MKKTFKETIVKEKNCLQIEIDTDCESPREWGSSLGYFITSDRNYHSPDKNPVLEGIVKQTGEVAESQEAHRAMIKKAVEALTDEVVRAIYPIVKYEHGGVCYQLGTRHGFDYSNDGFYIITDKTQKAHGVPRGGFEKVIKAELEEFNRYLNGEVYRFTLYNSEGELEDACSGFYNLEDIRSILPEEYKDEDLTDYLIH